ncbi:DUF1772 domain-containing protein [Actinoplanes sp. N902-109]|uniref:DUF1772 domain-containing protein n=1 Tax=Actinoplanes sp. (strain N902-109) TaxID=649831 RepID=UPI0003293408|nr:DUF1772 domain-containing protein [Actinoplanes sp. N902-109]AGL16616.1 hypothetical protein L083_3106 [Actinoplanes sp. N902-109]
MSVVVALVLLANGLAAGVLTGTQLGGWPLLAALPPDRYVHAHAFFSTRYDPFMPACLLATVAGDIVLAFWSDPAPARVLYLLGAVLAAGTVAISLTKNVPVNRWVRTLDPDRLPDDFASRDPRRSWGGWNRIRTALSVFALLINCAAVTVLL